MGELGGTIIDPGGGGGRSPAPGEGSGARWSGPGRDWNPPADLQSQDPADAGPGYGPDATFGPVPGNIIGGELREIDSVGEDDDDGFSDADIDDSNDGDDLPQDADFDTVHDCDSDDGEEDCLDSGGIVADNIVTSDAARGHCGPRLLTPGPSVILPTRGRPQRNA